MTPAAALLLLAVRGAPLPPAARQDSAVAVLLSRDGATRVVLTDRALDFNFTKRGGRRVRRSTDSAAAARPARAVRTEWFDAAALARRVTDGVVRGMHMTFPLEDVAEVRTEADLLTVCFVRRGPEAADAPACEKEHRFQFTGATPSDVARFAAALEQARAARTR